MQGDISLEEELVVLKRSFEDFAKRKCPSYYHFEGRSKQYPINEFELVQYLASELQSGERKVDEVICDLIKTDSIFALPYIKKIAATLPQENVENIISSIELWHPQTVINQYINRCYCKSVELKYTDDPEHRKELKRLLDLMINLFNDYTNSFKNLGFEITTSLAIIR